MKRKRIPLSESQKLGFGLIVDRLRQERENAMRFIRICLEENGGDLADPWTWNEPLLQWELNDNGTDSPDIG